MPMPNGNIDVTTKEQEVTISTGQNDTQLFDYVYGELAKIVPGISEHRIKKTTTSVSFSITYAQNGDLRKLADVIDPTNNATPRTSQFVNKLRNIG